MTCTQRQIEGFQQKLKDAMPMIQWPILCLQLCLRALRSCSYFSRWRLRQLPRNTQQASVPMWALRSEKDSQARFQDGFSRCV